MHIQIMKICNQSTGRDTFGSINIRQYAFSDVDKFVPIATKADYHDLRNSGHDFKVITREMGHKIFRIEM